MTDLPFPRPRENPLCLGHDRAFDLFERARHSGRLPHAWLLQGPRGIGKATFAFRLARHMLAPSDQNPDDPQSAIFRQVAHLSHGDLHLINRRPHPRTGRMQSHIVIETVREVVDKLHETASGRRGRVVLVDAADLFNTNAANGFLKILEEPPPQTVVLLVCHRPGAVLPTIRSRCAQLNLRPLSLDGTVDVIGPWLPDRQPDRIEALARLADGSPGRALKLALTGFLEAYAGLLDAAAGTADHDLPSQAIFDVLTEFYGRSDIHMTAELLGQTLHRVALLSGGADLGRPLVEHEEQRLAAISAGSPLDHWTSLWNKLNGLASRVDKLNNDPRQELMLAAMMFADRPTHGSGSSAPSFLAAREPFPI